MLHPIILCGGAGSRLWPASRPERPKPFIPLLDGRSMFAETVRRGLTLEDAAAPIIVAGPTHTALIRQELSMLGVRGTLLVEPEGRDSAPAMTAAALLVERIDPDGVCLFLAADHLIPDVAAFAATIRAGYAQAREGGIVTLGLRPSEPSSAYGYIAPAALVGDHGALKVDRFIEKPDAATARALVEEGCLWNSGMFIARCDVFLAEVRRHAALVGSQCAEALDQAARVGDEIRLGARFRTAPKISIDYAVMEHSDEVLVLPAGFAWSDLGAWNAVREALAPDDTSANVVIGDARLDQASGCFVYAEPGIGIAVKGVSDLAIVADGQGVLVSRLDAVEGIKGLVEAMPPAPVRKAEAEASSDDPLAGLVAWFEGSALPVWWALGADHEGGGYHESLVAGGRSAGPNRRMRVQARQTHVFARAGRAGWPGPWRQAVVQGLEALFGQYRRSDGLYRTLVSSRGQPVDVSVRLYDQAFVLLALASACQAGVRWASCRAEGRALVGQIRAAFTHPAGGFREEGDVPFQSNAHMHLLEACLAWMAIDEHPCWRELGRDIVDLALTRFIARPGGPLHEVFDADWAPAAGAAGQAVEPGHQFEWAWLLGQWSRLTDDPHALAAAIALYGHGAAGVDPVRGVAIDETDATLAPVRTTARLWPQTERLRAALFMAGVPGQDRQACLAAATEAARSLRRYLDQPGPGLWLDRMDASGAMADEPSPASSLYHLLSAVEAAREHSAGSGADQDDAPIPARVQG